MYGENRIIAFIAKHKVALLFGGILALILLFASRYSFISVQVQNGDAQNPLTYVIIDQKSGKSSSHEVKNTNFRKLAPKGTYIVTVSQNNQNFVKFVRTSGFLLTHRIDASLEREKSRKFVGENPDVCMNYIQDRLISHSCNGLYRTLRVHMPATANQPTYNLTAQESGDVIEGTVQTTEGTVVMTTPIGGDGSTGQLISLLGTDGKVSLKGKFHSELPVRNTNRILPYKNGFVVYDKALTYARYYESVEDIDPESISIEKPKDTKLSLYTAAGNSDTFAVGFMNANKSTGEDHHESVGLGTKSHIVIARNGQSKTISIPMVAERMELCGAQKLCVLSSGKVYVFDVSGKKSKELFTVPNAQAISSLNGQLLVVTTTNILRINVDDRSGSVDYTLGEYRYCGSGGAKNAYALCLISPQNRKVAVLIDPAQDNQDSIDKRVLELQKSKAVSLVSIYDRSIFIVPNYGAETYNPSMKIYDHDQATITRMNETFYQDLARTGINTSTYSVSGLRENY